MKPTYSELQAMVCELRKENKQMKDTIQVFKDCLKPWIPLFEIIHDYQSKQKSVSDKQTEK